MLRRPNHHKTSTFESVVPGCNGIALGNIRPYAYMEQLSLRVLLATVGYHFT